MKIHILIGVILLTVVTSCENDNDRIEKAKDVVNSFITNTSFDNYNVMYDLYPNFKNVSTYWKVKNFEIKTANISEDKNVTVVGNAGTHDLLFELNRNDGKYKIIRSKGLSSDFNSSIYRYAKNIGCIGASMYDSDISNICDRKKPEFNQLIKDIQKRIEDKVVLENHTVSKNYDWVSGDITLRNYSIFTIPRRTYNLYVHYLDRKDNIVFTSKEILNIEAIPFNQSKTINVFESNSKSFRKINIELKLISTEFIEEVLSKNAEGVACNYSDNI